MKIYAIGDLHLSSNSNKPMDIFGWHNHKERIFEDWKARVKPRRLSAFGRGHLMGNSFR